MAVKGYLDRIIKRVCHSLQRAVMSWIEMTLLAQPRELGKPDLQMEAIFFEWVNTVFTGMWKDGKAAGKKFVATTLVGCIQAATYPGPSTFSGAKII